MCALSLSYKYTVIYFLLYYTDFLYFFQPKDTTRKKSGSMDG